MTPTVAALFARYVEAADHYIAQERQETRARRIMHRLAASLGGSVAAWDRAWEAVAMDWHDRQGIRAYRARYAAQDALLNAARSSDLLTKVMVAGRIIADHQRGGTPPGLIAANNNRRA